jgi:hypothetical protein
MAWAYGCQTGPGQPKGIVKSNTWDEAILAEHRAYLREDSAKDAFNTLVAIAIELPGYETSPDWHGEIRDFRYDDTVSGERPFAFIVNRSDLLFYVRRPGLRRVVGGFAGLKGSTARSRELVLQYDESASSNVPSLRETSIRDNEIWLASRLA